MFSMARDTKDTLIVTNCGAEAIAFLKVYGVIPAVTAFMMFYTKLANRFDSKVMKKMLDVLATRLSCSHQCDVVMFIDSILHHVGAFLCFLLTVCLLPLPPPPSHSPNALESPGWWSCLSCESHAALVLHFILHYV